MTQALSCQQLTRLLTLFKASCRIIVNITPSFAMLSYRIATLWKHFRLGVLIPQPVARI